jgi:hypothetical protein
MAKPLKVRLRRRNQVIAWSILIAAAEVFALLFLVGLLGPQGEGSAGGRFMSAAGLALFGLFLYLLYVLPCVVLSDRGVKVVDWFGLTKLLSWSEVVDVVSDPGVVIKLKNGKQVRVTSLSPTGFDRLLPSYEEGTARFVSQIREWMIWAHDHAD